MIHDYNNTIRENGYLHFFVFGIIVKMLNYTMKFFG